MGAGADVNGFFGIMTMVIAIPTGVKVFNWLFTMYQREDTFYNANVLVYGLYSDIHHWRSGRSINGRTAN